MNPPPAHRACATGAPFDPTRNANEQWLTNPDSDVQEPAAETLKNRFNMLRARRFRVSIQLNVPSEEELLSDSRDLPREKSRRPATRGASPVLTRGVNERLMGQAMAEKSESRLSAVKRSLEALPAFEVYGRVAAVRGLLIEIAGPVAAMHVGGRIEIETGRGGMVPCEVIGFSGERALAMPFGALAGVRRGCPAHVRDEIVGVRPSRGWLGRVVDALGRPIDGKRPLPQGPTVRPFRADPPPAHARRRVGAPLDLGVRAMNTFLTVCAGQRMGIFSGSGIGKSVLLSMFARYTAADVAVIGLVGERGREVQEFLQDDLGAEGLARSIVVVATSDEPALMRRNAALTLALSEHFQDEGAAVL